MSVHQSSPVIVEGLSLVIARIDSVRKIWLLITMLIEKAWSPSSMFLIFPDRQ